MIKKIYASGCSWTAGNGIEDDPLYAGVHKSKVNTYIHTWPVHLGKELGVSAIYNDATGGGSNARILRKLIDFTRRLPEEERETTLVVIGWTSVERSEIFIDHKSQHTPDGWYRFNATQKFDSYLQGLPVDKVNDICEFQRSYLANAYEHKGCVEVFYQQLYLAKHLLMSLNIPFIFFAGCCSMDFQPNKLVQKDLDDPHIIDMVNLTMHNWLRMNNIKIGPSIHPLIDGHQAWAKYLASELISRKIIT